LTLNGSTANTDTSTTSWNNDPNGYTYAIMTVDGNLLTASNANEFSVPESLFVNGVVTVCITHTKAENGVFITVTPNLPGLNQTSAKMNFTADEITNYLIEITSNTSTPDQVYKYRLYEIVVSPRDRFLNVSNNQIATTFSARFPGEFVTNIPGTSNIFSGTVYIQGVTNYFLTSTLAHVKGTDPLQWIRATSVNDGTVNSRSNEYEILEHPPDAFALQNPPDKSIMRLQSHSRRETFDWEVSTDPYTNIDISRFDNKIGNDVVMYEIRFYDSASVTIVQPFESDNAGLDNKFTVTHGQLQSIIKAISGSENIKVQNVVWNVAATDHLNGDVDYLYTTLSTPPNGPSGAPGYYLTIIRDSILSTGPALEVPSEFALEQNYPNPFNPTTSIAYALPKSTQVSMVVYDLLGNVVRTIVSKHQDAGSYRVTWDATNDQGVQVPTGNYILKMVAGDFTKTRKMTLLK
jgi:hypothetical protein